jgi:hypothetical protein
MTNPNILTGPFIILSNLHIFVHYIGISQDTTEDVSVSNPQSGMKKGLNVYTVKPVYNGHPWDLKKVAV